MSWAFLDCPCQLSQCLFVNKFCTECSTWARGGEGVLSLRCRAPRSRSNKAGFSFFSPDLRRRSWKCQTEITATSSTVVTYVYLRRRRSKILNGEGELVGYQHFEKKPKTREKDTSPREVKGTSLFVVNHYNFFWRLLTPQYSRTTWVTLTGIYWSMRRRDTSQVAGRDPGKGEVSSVMGTTFLCDPPFFPKLARPGSVVISCDRESRFFPLGFRKYK